MRNAPKAGLLAMFAVLDEEGDEDGLTLREPIVLGPDTGAGKPGERHGGRLIRVDLDALLSARRKAGA